MSEWSFLDFIGYGAVLLAISASAINDVLRDFELLPRRGVFRVPLLLSPIILMIASGGALLWDKFFPEKASFDFINSRPYVIDEKRFVKVTIKVKVPKFARSATIRLLSFIRVSDGDTLNTYIQPLLPWTEGPFSYIPRNITSESYFGFMLVDKIKHTAKIMNKDQDFAELSEMENLAPGTYKATVELSSDNQVSGYQVFIVKWTGTTYELEKS